MIRALIVLLLKKLILLRRLLLKLAWTSEFKSPRSISIQPQLKDQCMKEENQKRVKFLKKCLLIFTLTRSPLVWLRRKKYSSNIEEGTTYGRVRAFKFLRG